MILGLTWFEKHCWFPCDLGRDTNSPQSNQGIPNWWGTCSYHRSIRGEMKPHTHENLKSYASLEVSWTNGYFGCYLRWKCFCAISEQRKNVSSVGCWKNGAIVKKTEGTMERRKTKPNKIKRKHNFQFIHIFNLPLNLLEGKAGSCFWHFAVSSLHKFISIFN